MRWRGTQWSQKKILEPLRGCRNQHLIILGQNYIGYDSALLQTKLQRLDIRRTTLSLSFAKKSARHPLHSNWFCKQQQDNSKMKTRAPKPTFKPAKARTQRLMKSPIPYLTGLLNDDATKIWYQSSPIDLVYIYIYYVYNCMYSCKRWHLWIIITGVGCRISDNTSLSSDWWTVVHH